MQASCPRRGDGEGGAACAMLCRRSTTVAPARASMRPAALGLPVAGSAGRRSAALFLSSLSPVFSSLSLFLFFLSLLSFSLLFFFSSLFFLLSPVFSPLLLLFLSFLPSPSFSLSSFLFLFLLSSFFLLFLFSLSSLSFSLLFSLSLCSSFAFPFSFAVSLSFGSLDLAILSLVVLTSSFYLRGLRPSRATRPSLSPIPAALLTGVAGLFLLSLPLPLSLSLRAGLPRPLALRLRLPKFSPVLFYF